MLRTADSRAAQIAQLLEGKAKRAGALASWPSRYNPLLDLNYDNNAESTAFALRFLTHADPQSPLLGAAAQWLVLNRNGGYWWNSTEQTAMVLFGLVDYLAASQELDADFDADVLLNGSSIGKRTLLLPMRRAARRCRLMLLRPSCSRRQYGRSREERQRAALTGRCRASFIRPSRALSAGHSLAESDSRLLQAGRYAEGWRRSSTGSIRCKGPVQPGDTLAVHLAVNGSPAKYLLIEDPIPAGTEFVQHEDSTRSSTSRHVGVLVHAARVP